RQTANIYMAYLAGSICRENEGFYPVTDKSHVLSDLVEPGYDVGTRLRTLRYAAITQALPVPSQPLSPAELKSFKDLHGEQLCRLRRYLDGQLVDLAAIDDPFLRDVKTESVLQEIRDDVAVLTEQMSKRRWPRIVLVGIGGVLASAMTVGTAIVAGGTPLALGLGIGAGIVSMGPAGFEAADLMGSPRIAQRSPLAYPALGQPL